MRVSTNVHALVAKRHMYNANKSIEKENQGLSSGDRISRAAYDPAGLAISETMRARSRSMGQSIRNINDGISLFQVGEGTLGVLQNMTNRLRELTLQSMSDTVSDSERAMTNMEFQQIKTEINKLTQSTKFNGNHILNGKAHKYEVQVGIDGSPNEDRVLYNMKRVLDSAGNFNMDSASIGTKAAAQATLSKINNISDKISGGRAELGAVMNRFQHMSTNMQVSLENNERAKSMIRDTDVAEATAQRTISNLKMSAATGMLQTMNNSPSNVMKLLG